MTETELTIEFNNACSNYIPNRSLEKLLYKGLTATSEQTPTKDEILFAEKMWNSLSISEQESHLSTIRGFWLLWKWQ